MTPAAERLEGLLRPAPAPPAELPPEILACARETPQETWEALAASGSIPLDWVGPVEATGRVFVQPSEAQTVTVTRIEDWNRRIIHVTDDVGYLRRWVDGGPGGPWAGVRCLTPRAPPEVSTWRIVLRKGSELPRGVGVFGQLVIEPTLVRAPNKFALLPHPPTVRAALVAAHRRAAVLEAEALLREMPGREEDDPVCWTTTGDGGYATDFRGSSERAWALALERCRRARAVLDLLLDNHVAHLDRNGHVYPPGVMARAFAEFQRAARPVSTVARDIVSVQPMTAPVGDLFYREYVYGWDRPGDALAAAAESAGPLTAALYCAVRLCFSGYAEVVLSAPYTERDAELLTALSAVARMWVSGVVCSGWAKGSSLYLPADPG